jgi:hypothetical protein
VEIDRIMGNAIGWADFGTLMPDTPEVGANTHVYAAFDPEVVGKPSIVFLFRLDGDDRSPLTAAAHNGGYLQSCRVSDPWTDTVRPWATSSLEAERLWKLSEKLVGQEFSY